LENPDLILDKQDLKRILDFIKRKEKIQGGYYLWMRGILGLNYEFEVRQSLFIAILALIRQYFI